VKRTRRRYLLIRYDESLYASDHLRELMSRVAEGFPNEDSHFKHTFFVLEPGLAILSIPHKHLPQVKERISSLYRGLEVILASGTLEGIRRKMGARSSQKGLSEPHHS